MNDSYKMIVGIGSGIYKFEAYVVGNRYGVAVKKEGRAVDVVSCNDEQEARATAWNLAHSGPARWWWVH